VKQDSVKQVVRDLSTPSRSITFQSIIEDVYKNLIYRVSSTKPPVLQPTSTPIDTSVVRVLRPVCRRSVAAGDDRRTIHRPLYATPAIQQVTMATEHAH